jgi:prevent-host-death family protein
MKIVSIYEAKTHLSALVERAHRGEEIIVAKGGKPVARLVPLEDKAPVRKPGRWKNKGWIADDFGEPLPPEIAKGFGIG